MAALSEMPTFNALRELPIFGFRTEGRKGVYRYDLDSICLMYT